MPVPFPVRVGRQPKAAPPFCLLRQPAERKDMNQAIISGDVDSAILADQIRQKNHWDSMPLDKALARQGRIDFAGDVHVWQKNASPGHGLE